MSCAAGGKSLLFLLDAPVLAIQDQFADCRQTGNYPKTGLWEKKDRDSGRMFDKSEVIPMDLLNPTLR